MGRNGEGETIDVPARGHSVPPPLITPPLKSHPWLISAHGRRTDWEAEGVPAVPAGPPAFVKSMDSFF